MGWEDRTSYQAIELQFELTPSELVHFMRFALDEKSFKRWRRRIFEQGKLKNETPEGFRFKSKSQRMDGSTKNYKRGSLHQPTSKHLPAPRVEESE
jgi:uncharacterized protein (TIGR03643 family)